MRVRLKLQVALLENAEKKKKRLAALASRKYSFPQSNSTTTNLRNNSSYPAWICDFFADIRGNIKYSRENNRYKENGKKNLHLYKKTKNKNGHKNNLIISTSLHFVNKSFVKKIVRRKSSKKRRTGTFVSLFVCI